MSEGAVPFWKRLRREARVRLLLLSLPLLRRLPWRLGGALGAAVGWLGSFLARGEGRRALEHLSLAYPDAAPAWRRKTARAVFAHLGRSSMEVLLVGRIAPSFAEHVVLDAGGEALLAEAAAARSGVLFASCHVGNWELLARRVARSLTALGVECATVAREAQDPRLTELLEKARADAGVKTLWRGKPGVAKDMLRLLRAGGFLGLLVDQDIRDAQGQFVEFFGRQAHTPRVVGDLALRTGARVIFGCVHRERGRHRVVLERVPVPTDPPDAEAASREVTQAVTRLIEREVRARPDEWVWMHNRWRTRP